MPRHKPDMTLEERNNEKILLTECWSLLQRGVNREIIKIRGNNIFVNNKIHGKVKQGQFCLLNIPTSDSTQPSTKLIHPLPTSNLWLTSETNSSSFTTCSTDICNVTGRNFNDHNQHANKDHPAPTANK